MDDAIEIKRWGYTRKDAGVSKILQGGYEQGNNTRENIGRDEREYENTNRRILRKWRAKRGEWEK